MLKASKRIVFRELAILNQEVAKITNKFKYDVEVSKDYRAGNMYHVVEMNDGLRRTPDITAGDMIVVLTGMTQIVKDINDAIPDTSAS